MATERSDDRYDLVFTPARYAPLQADSEGRWSVLSAADGIPLGVAWTDAAEGAGFIQARPNELGEDIWSDFSVAASMKVPAVSAYQLALAKSGVRAGEEMTGKLEDVYRTLTKTLDNIDALTAALTAKNQIEQARTADEAIPEDAHLYLTVDDDDQNAILEFVRSDETGMYIRDNSSWMPIDPESDNPRVWDRTIIDVTPEAVPLFDEAERERTLTVDLFDGVLAPDEEAQP